MSVTSIKQFSFCSFLAPSLTQRFLLY